MGGRDKIHSTCLPKIICLRVLILLHKINLLAYRLFPRLNKKEESGNESIFYGQKSSDILYFLHNLHITLKYGFNSEFM
jgi:hypothetical protein